jgi:hypothetical protein
VPAAAVEVSIALIGPRISERYSRSELKGVKMSEGKSSALTALCALSITLSQFCPCPAKGNRAAAKWAFNQRSSVNITANEAPTQSPLACNAMALEARQKQRIRALLEELRAETQEVRELPNGYAFRLPAQASVISSAAEYVDLERRCCPFFDFVLSAKREGGPVWITLSGRAGTKEFAKAEFDIGQIHSGSSGDVAIKGKDSPFICNDQALTAEQFRRLVQLLKKFRTGKQCVKEFTDGYAIQLPSDPSLIQDVGEYMAILRLCSPYFEPTLEVEREGGPTWLKLVGRSGVKELAKTELGI